MHFFSLSACGAAPESGLQTPSSANNFEGEDYQNVMIQLQDAGFTNIETEILDDLVTGWLTKEGEVEQISINGETDFSDGTWFPEEAKVKITYHTFPEDVEAAEEAKAPKKEETEQVAKEKAEQEAKEKAEKETQAKAEKEAKEKKEQEELEAKQSRSSVSFDGYKLIEVAGDNLSGSRQANVVVDVGFGDREYWAFTNEHGQLVRVVASEITLQDDSSEPVNSSGRYYHDEAKVPGTESSTLDEGHVIADSLGGVANAYNITPQNSTLNRHGDQAYMERNISQAGGAINFEAIISYPDTKTQIPSKYKYTYTIQGNTVVDEYENVNPDDYNKDKGITSNPKTEPKKETKKEDPKPEPKEEATAGGDLSAVDANGNGTVTIGEAKDAGYSMPIKKGHWLYEYMIDRDGDGMVGE